MAWGTLCCIALSPRWLGAHRGNAVPVPGDLPLFGGDSVPRVLRSCFPLCFFFRLLKFTAVVQ